MKKLLLTAIALWLGINGSCALPHVSFVTPDIARIRWNVDGQLTDNATGICVYDRDQPVHVDTLTTPSATVYRTSALSVEVDNRSGAVAFFDRSAGRLLLRENPSNPMEHSQVADERIVYDDSSARLVETANGKVTVKDILRRDTVGINDRYKVNFIFNGGEALYGLGSHMEDYMNLAGKTVYLTQHNLKATVPVLVSTGGFALMFDAGCSMKFESKLRPDGNYDGTMELEAADTDDYYFIRGDDMAEVVGGYRFLTGQVSMMPRYMFGYIQSKERYTSSADITATLAEYRRRHVPIDLIVQDWNYWPEGWGYMKMNRTYYPSPKALADSVHDMHARLMVSIWPNPQYCPQEDDFRKRGYMLEHSVYDVFNPDARDYYWKYANDEFFSNGFDAWWCDSSEPLDGDWNQRPEPVDGRSYGRDDHEVRWKLNTAILDDALGAKRSNLYSLYHSRGIYENQRRTTDRKRVVNLTRSSYAGQQRYGTVVWNGDTYASWESFRQQIPSGLNYMATGNPYWTVDVGSFFTKSDPRWFYRGEFPQGVADDGYKEYYTRMFQWGTFLPVLRSHGTDTPREIWQFGEPGTPYYDAILKMINLRYSLIPYIYSMAWAQSSGNYSMARPLAFDFTSDPDVFDIKDQYMFGDFLVCPVTFPGAPERQVYLPKGTTWTDYWTGTVHQGGRWIACDTPLDRLPLFVKAGGIIPTARPCEYTDAIDTTTLAIDIYPGKDGYFELYDDDGITYQFEQGQYSSIPLIWNESSRELTVGKAKGNLKTWPDTFKINIGDKSVTVKYDGSEKTISL